MKNITLTGIIITGITATSSTLYCKSFMPRIEQLRNKIEAVSQNVQSVNFKKLLETATVEQDDQGKIRKIISLDQQTTSIATLENELTSLYWSNQTDFIAQIQTKKTAPKTERLELLHNVIAKKYPNNKRALVTMAGDLAQEEIKLDELTTRIFKTIGNEADAATKKALNTLLQTTTRLKQQLLVISNFVNEALTS